MNKYNDIKIGDSVYVSTESNERSLPLFAHSQFLGSEQYSFQDCDDYKINTAVEHVTECYFDVIDTEGHGVVRVPHGVLKKVNYGNLKKVI